MPYKTTSIDKIKEQYNVFLEKQKCNDNILDDNHRKIRDFFVENYYELKMQGYTKYKIDLNLALKFYVFLENQPDFNHLYRSDYNFWKYIAVFDIPDIIADRFGINSVDHFYMKNQRTYPFTLYWYIYLSWQGDVDSTYEILKSNSTDNIEQLVERLSKIGVNVDVYRNFMKKYSLLPQEIKRKKFAGANDSLYRVLLKKNSSKMAVTRPEIYKNGIDDYVDMIFGEYAIWRSNE